MSKKYIPNAGDIIWIDFDPQAGREQSRRRPALVLSPDIYNKKSSLVLVCPITSMKKQYPFEVEIDSELVKGAVLSDQVKSMNWNIRNAEFIEACPSEIIDKVRGRILKLIK